MRTSALIFAGVLAWGLGFVPARAQNATPGSSNQSQTSNQYNQNQNRGTSASTSSQRNYSSSQQQGTQQSANAQNRNAPGMRSVQARQSEEASDLLSATDQARNAILNYDKQDAIEHIDHALAKAQEIEQQKPGRFVPIYDELSRYSVIEPVMQSRNQNQQEYQEQQESPQAANQQYSQRNQQYSQRNQQPGASQQSASQSNASQQTQRPQVELNQERPFGVQDVVGSFTSIDLDVKAAQDHLRAAKQALQNGDYGAADAALKAVQDGVDVASLSLDLPLVQARENLMLARESAINGDQRESRAALRDAAHALREYAKMGGSHSSQATALCSQIENAANSGVQSGTQASSNSATQIENWWNQLAGWTQAAHS